MDERTATKYEEAVVSLKELLVRTQDQEEALELAIQLLEGEIKIVRDGW